MTREIPGSTIATIGTICLVGDRRFMRAVPPIVQHMRVRATITADGAVMALFARHHYSLHSISPAASFMIACLPSYTA